MKNNREILSYGYGENLQDYKLRDLPRFYRYGVQGFISGLLFLSITNGDTLLDYEFGNKEQQHEVSGDSQVSSNIGNLERNLFQFKNS